MGAAAPRTPRGGCALLIFNARPAAPHAPLTDTSAPPMPRPCPRSPPGDLEPTVGESRRSVKLRIGRYNQHFVDALSMDVNPVEYLLSKWVAASLVALTRGGRSALLYGAASRTSAPTHPRPLARHQPPAAPSSTTADLRPLLLNH